MLSLIFRTALVERTSKSTIIIIVAIIGYCRSVDSSPFGVRARDRQDDVETREFAREMTPERYGYGAPFVSRKRRTHRTRAHYRFSTYSIRPRFYRAVVSRCFRTSFSRRFLQRDSRPIIQLSKGARVTRIRRNRTPRSYNPTVGRRAPVGGHPLLKV